MFVLLRRVAWRPVGQVFAAGKGEGGAKEEWKKGVAFQGGRMGRAGQEEMAGAGAETSHLWGGVKGRCVYDQ